MGTLVENGTKTGAARKVTFGANGSAQHGQEPLRRSSTIGVQGWAIWTRASVQRVAAAMQWLQQCPGKDPAENTRPSKIHTTH